VRIAAAGSWLSPRLEVGDGAVARWAGETLEELGAGVDALLVATSDAGARESVRFWRESRVTGLTFANPRAFPWTLANSPAGEIARLLGVRGPTFTLVGGGDAAAAALAHALDELAAGRARRALVAALDGVGERTRLAAVVVAREGALGTAEPAAAPEGALDLATPSETLEAALAALARGDAVAVGSERDGWVELGPPHGGVDPG
jgi:hypothetical protein